MTVQPVSAPSGQLGNSHGNGNGNGIGLSAHMDSTAMLEVMNFLLPSV